MKPAFQPYNLLIPIFLLLFVISFFRNPHATIDLHLYTAYVVIAVPQALRLFAIILLLLWGIYKLADRILLSKVITWIHTLITIITVTTISAVIFWDGLIFPAALPRRYIDYSEFDALAQLNKIVGITATVFLIAQLLFIVNLTGGFFKARKAPKYEL